MDGNISKYKALVAAVEYGSFTKAAEVLNYSQSAVSRMISDLEKEWNISLLERGKSGVSLTSDGIALLPHARSLCEAYDKMKMQADALAGLESGVIRIGTFSSVATHWLPKMIQEFQKDYPKIKYELLLGDYHEIEAWILEGRVDCGFLRLPANPELETIFLEQDRLLAVLPEQHPLTKKDRLSIADLCSEPFLMLQKGTQTDISAIFQKSGLTPTVQFMTWDDYAIMSMVESGLGISVLPELILRRIPYRITVRELEIPVYRRIALAMRNKNSASLAVKKFLPYLKYRDSSSL